MAHRLGVVSFLNARPLIEGLDGDRNIEMVFDVPALLAGRLERGEVDAALIPIVDLLRYRGKYRVVSDACIGCDGETMTVRVFSQVPPDRMQRLWVDPDSHTSVALAAVLWRQLYDRQLLLQPFDPRQHNIDDFESVLLIGDKVVDSRRGSFAYEIDLGGAWRQHTGLPFVFAAWAAPNLDFGFWNLDSEEGRPSSNPKSKIQNPKSTLELAGLLAEARNRGVVRAAEIAEEQGPALGWPVELAKRYLTRCLKFRMDERYVEGANLFARLCGEAGIVAPDAEILWPDLPFAQETA